MKNAVLCAALVVLSCNISSGQQYKVLWSFGGAAVGDGSQPLDKLVADKNGNLYGTTEYGGTGPASDCGSLGCGTVFELSPTHDGTWTETIIYSFCTSYSGFLCLDGALPFAGLIFDSAGNLYGTTSYGGQSCPPNGSGCGTVFELSPPALPGASWTETVLYSFCASGMGIDSVFCPDGAMPHSKLTFDQSGNLFGTTWIEGIGNAGTVFELTPEVGGWTESVLYNFCTLGKYPVPCPDGVAPEAGVTLDQAGNLYGTTVAGGSKQFLGGGVVYKLSPSQQGWSETVLYSFTSPGRRTGSSLYGSVNFDNLGNLFSTVAGGGLNGAGGVFRLSPKAPREITFSFSGDNGYQPVAGVLIDPRNNDLYGTTEYGGAGGVGVVFKIAGTTETVLHSFTGGTDGQQPVAALTADGKGNLYGTTEYGGTNDLGTVFEITP